MQETNFEGLERKKYFEVPQARIRMPDSQNGLTYSIAPQLNEEPMGTAIKQMIPSLALVGCSTGHQDSTHY